MKFMARINKTVVFFMDSKEAAKNLIDYGYFCDPYLLVFEPFVFAPNICCRNCGSKKHKDGNARIL